MRYGRLSCGKAYVPLPTGAQHRRPQTLSVAWLHSRQSSTSLHVQNSRDKVHRSSSTIGVPSSNHLRRHERQVLRRDDLVGVNVVLHHEALPRVLVRPVPELGHLLDARVDLCLCLGRPSWCHTAAGLLFVFDERGIRHRVRSVARRAESFAAWMSVGVVVLSSLLPLPFQAQAVKVRAVRSTLLEGEKSRSKTT